MRQAINIVVLLILLGLAVFAGYRAGNGSHISPETRYLTRVDTLYVRDTVEVSTVKVVRDTVIKEVRVIEYRDSLIEIKVLGNLGAEVPVVNYRFLRPLYNLSTTHYVRPKWAVSMSVGANLHGGVALAQGYYDDKYIVGYDFLNGTILLGYKYSF